MASLNNFDFIEYHQKCLEEMPADVLAKAVKFLATWINEEDKKLIGEAYSKDPATWWASYHFGWGMAVRNALRTEAMLDDGLLPKYNWDDYYIACVEVALFLRPIESKIINKILEEAKRETERKSYRRIVVG